jgi:hypothetical protein
VDCFLGRNSPAASRARAISSCGATTSNWVYDGNVYGPVIREWRSKVVGRMLTTGGRMSRTVRILAYVIGAKWFFPISFLAVTIASVPLFSWLGERHVERGALPHSLFFVVWQPGQAGEPFGFSRLADLTRIKTPAPVRSFIMEQPTGRIEDGKSTTVAYQVISSTASEQYIEVAYADDTYSSWSRYRATRSEVTPVFSKVMEPGQLLMAVPVALGFAAAIYALGTWLRKRLDRDNRQASHRSDG